MKLRLPKLKLLLQKHRIAQLGISFLQKKGTFRAYFVTFALLKVCQIFSNVSLHTYYVEVNLLTLPHKLRYSLDFYCQVNFVYLRFFSPGWTLLKLLKKHSCLNVLLLLFKQILFQFSYFFTMNFDLKMQVHKNKKLLQQGFQSIVYQTAQNMTFFTFLYEQTNNKWQPFQTHFTQG